MNKLFNRIAASAALVATLCGAMPVAAHAQSDASLAVSMLPVASVVGTASMVGGSVGAVSAVPIVLSAAGAVFVIKAVEVSARGTVYVLERASDGARFSVEVSAGAVSGTALVVGTSVRATVIGAGVVLSAAGEVIAFIPNEIGKALLYNERVTF